MRVESLQHASWQKATISARVFQYPPCGSSRCNVGLMRPEPSTVPSFQYPPCGSSRCNTRATTTSHRLFRLFQYPPCGSSRCNHQMKSGEQQKAQVFQYPPCGSSRCNAFWRAHIVGEDESFSTLHAGRVAATSLEPWRGILATTLSVPSMRVESLQPRAARVL